MQVKKIINSLIFSLFFWTSVGYSQDIGDFNAVKTYDGLSVTLISSSENKLEFSGEDKESIVVENSKGTLKISLKISKLFAGYKTFVKVFHKDPLTIVQANDESFIKFNKTIQQDLIQLEAYESAIIEADLNVDQLLVKAFFNGEVKASGTSHNQDITINTGGTYSGEKLKTTLTTVAVNAGGNASVFASDYVQANVKAGGTVLIYGNPSKVDEKTLFGGFIKKMNN